MGNVKSSLKATNSTSTTTASNKIGSTTAISRTIDKQIKADQKSMKKEVKLLLLGTKSLLFQ
jgi:hypothetical protein